MGVCLQCGGALITAAVISWHTAAWAAQGAAGAPAHNLGALELLRLLQQKATERLIAVERAAVRADLGHLALLQGHGLGAYEARDGCGAAGAEAERRRKQASSAEHGLRAGQRGRARVGGQADSEQTPRASHGLWGRSDSSTRSGTTPRACRQLGAPISHACCACGPPASARHELPPLVIRERRAARGRRGRPQRPAR